MLDCIKRMDTLLEGMRSNLSTVKKQRRGWRASAARARKLSLALTKEMKEFRKLSVQAAEEEKNKNCRYVK